MTPALLPAADPPAINEAATAFMLVAASMVLLMTPGLALFYGGMTRAKSVLNMIMMSFGALGVVGVIPVRLSSRQPGHGTKQAAHSPRPTPRVRSRRSPTMTPATCSLRRPPRAPRPTRTRPVIASTP